MGRGREVPDIGRADQEKNGSVTEKKIEKRPGI